MKKSQCQYNACVITLQWYYNYGFNFQDVIELIFVVLQKKYILLCRFRQVITSKNKQQLYNIQGDSSNILIPFFLQKCSYLKTDIQNFKIIFYNSGDFFLLLRRVLWRTNSLISSENTPFNYKLYRHTVVDFSKHFEISKLNFVGVIFELFNCMFYG